MPINFSGISSAMYDTPSNYKNSHEYYKQNLQYKINETYEFAPDTYDILYEKNIGTLEFNNIVCRVCHAISPKTGLNLGDDFKELIFFNLYDSKRLLGERYKFDDSIWITTNTDNLHHLTQSAIIRRCNNTLNFIDGFGNIIREPCIVGYSMKYSNIYYNDVIEIPQGTTTITVQANKNTETIQVNDRFILDGVPYKVKVVKNYLRNYTNVSKSNPLIEIDVFIDSKAPDDNVELGIANMDKYKNIYPQKDNVLNGIVISPKVNAIYQQETIKFECYNYIDGVKQNSNFIFTINKKNSDKLNFSIIDNNHFSITSLGYDEVPVIVNCKTLANDSDYIIHLRGLY